MIDSRTPLGQRALERLRDDQIIWLTTTDSRGFPQPNPVWFVWDGETFQIYTQPKAKRLVNIALRPQVSLHFNSDPMGDDIVVLTGEARLDPAASPPGENAAYVEKYREGMKYIGMTPEQYSGVFSVALRVHRVRLRGLNIGGVDLDGENQNTPPR